MICNNCDGNLIIKTGQRYHYVMSGLDNVYLENIEVEECESCGQITPYIPSMPTLHKMIAERLVLKSSALIGKEIRFLRKERRKKAKDWAALLKVEPETLSRWENEEKQPSESMDQYIRLLYCRVFEEQEKQLFTSNVLNRFVDLTENQQFTINIDVTNLLVQIDNLAKQCTLETSLVL